MKLDLFKTVVIIAVGALLGWGFSEMCHNDSMKMAMFITMVIIFILGAIGLSLTNREYPRAAFNAHIVASVFLLVLILLNLLYIFSSSFSAALYVVPNAIIILLGAVVYRAIFRSRV